MKEEMQGFHMTPNFEIYISEITLFWPDYTSIHVGPRTVVFVTKKPQFKVQGLLLISTLS